MASSAQFTSDLEYLDAVIQVLHAANISANDYYIAKDATPYDGEKAASYCHDLNERLSELHQLILIGPLLITMATTVQHPNPPSWGRAFVQETRYKNDLQSHGLPNLIATLRDRHDELVTWRGHFTGHPSQQDDSAYVRMADIWREHFRNAGQCTRFLDSHKTIRSKKEGSKRFIHLGDWHEHWKANEKKTEDALDEPAFQHLIEGIEKRKAKVKLKKRF